MALHLAQSMAPRTGEGSDHYARLWRVFMCLQFKHARKAYSAALAKATSTCSLAGEATGANRASVLHRRPVTHVLVLLKGWLCNTDPVLPCSALQLTRHESAS